MTEAIDNMCSICNGKGTIMICVNDKLESVPPNILDPDLNVMLRSKCRCCRGTGKFNVSEKRK